MVLDILKDVIDPPSKRLSTVLSRYPFIRIYPGTEIGFKNFEIFSNHQIRPKFILKNFYQKTNSSNGEKNCQLLREEIIKMEKKLANANEEKEYYKRHFHGEQNGRNINGCKSKKTKEFLNF